MIAQAILSLLLCTVLIYAWAEYRRSPVVALMSLVASVVGLYFVWIPSHTTRVAEFIGIGRGADLIMYLWICISLIVLLNLHLKLRSQHEVITALARAIALANADSATEGTRLRSTEHETAKPAIPLARDASGPLESAVLAPSKRSRNRRHSDVMPKTANAGGDSCRR